MVYKSIELEKYEKNHDNARDMDVENNNINVYSSKVDSPRTLAERLQGEHSAKKIIAYQKGNVEKQKKANVLHSLQAYQKSVITGS